MARPSEGSAVVAAAAPTAAGPDRLRRPAHPFLRAFFRSPSGLLSLVLITLLMLDVIFAPIFLTDPATNLSLLHANEGPSAAHLAGTDQLGRDLLARTLIAGRLSVEISLGAAVIAALLGLAIGLATATVGRRVRTTLERGVDAMIAFPAIIIIVLISTVIGTGLTGAVIGVGVAGSARFARLVSTLAASIGGRDFVRAARILGVSRRKIMTRHVLPNIAEPVVISLSFILTVALIVNSGLSFLGLGVQPPRYDWGRMLTEGVQSLYLNPLLAVVPAVALAIAALAIGFFGEAVARALNPRLWIRPEVAKRRRRQIAAIDLLAPAPDLDRLAGSAGAAAEAEAEADAKGDPGADADDLTPAKPLLTVRDLTVSFPHGPGWTDVVRGVSFSIAPGARLGIVGESGSGKTMTMLAIAQLTPFPGRMRGTVALQGSDLGRLRQRELDALLGRQLGFIFQDPMSSLNPALTIGRHLTERAEVHQGLSKKDATVSAVARLREVNLPAPASHLHQYPRELSGGMRQRAMIAMSLINQPSLLICDEPTTALDVTVQAQIMDLLGHVNADVGAAIMLVSHDLGLIAQNCERILVMYAGRIVEDLSRDQLRADPRHPYTRALLAAVPDPSQHRDHAFASIAGEPPDSADPPPGCPFHPRCPLATERCRAQRPPLRRESSGRRLACWVTGAST
jgi:peptide/nickel transport system permease protein